MKFSKPKRFDYNLVTLGAGPGGLIASYIASTMRAKVALIEKKKMGGDCLNTGCVPSKGLIRTAKVFASKRKAHELGLRKIEIEFDFGEVMQRLQRVIQKIEPRDSVERYQKMGVDVFLGDGKILSPYEVLVDSKRLTTRNIVIATGAHAFVPPLPGIEKVNPLTSDNVWQLRQLPKRFLVLGGGTIGSEIAQCFARFGSHVIQVEGGARLMPREDAEISHFIMKVFEEEGIEIRTGIRANRFEIINGKKTLIAKNGEREEQIEFDEVLIALGRRPTITGFGLEELGVKITERGSIAANGFLQTNYPNIFGCGDVVGPFQFTHTAAYQGYHAAVNALFGPFKMFKTDYRVIPWCTFTDPEIARVGHSEETAKAAGLQYEISQFGLEHLDRAITDEEDRGFIKVLTKKGTDKIEGVTIVSAHAGEILAEFATAMKYGIGLRKILKTMHSYPTFSEANKFVAGNWLKSHTPAWIFKWLTKFHAWRRGE